MAYEKVFVVAETEKNLPELCQGAATMGAKVNAVVFCEREKAEKAYGYGVEKVYAIEKDEEAMIEDYAKIVADLLKTEEADLVLMTSSIRSSLLAGKIAAYADTCVSAGVAEVYLEDGVGMSKKMVYGGAAFRTEKLAEKMSVVTLGAGAFAPMEADETRTGEVIVVAEKPAVTIKRLSIEKKQEAPVNLATAKRIIDMGRGFSKEEDLEWGKKLASILGADVGCSRPVAESNGWMPHSRYIGVTGVVLKPELCFVIGVSGQVQHLVGINQSKTIIAINKDKNAPIFKHADFGLAGDMNKILPVLIEKLS